METINLSFENFRWIDLCLLIFFYYYFNQNPQKKKNKLVDFWTRISFLLKGDQIYIYIFLRNVSAQCSKFKSLNSPIIVYHHAQQNNVDPNERRFLYYCLIGNNYSTQMRAFGRIYVFNRNQLFVFKTLIEFW